eukprot:139466-Pelagomonas_calceolata.AAC.1
MYKLGKKICSSKEKAAACAALHSSLHITPWHDKKSECTEVDVPSRWQQAHRQVKQQKIEPRTLQTSTCASLRSTSTLHFDGNPKKQQGSSTACSVSLGGQADEPKG